MRVIDADRFALIEGDCAEALADLGENTIDSCVTDPPYELTAARPGGRSEATRGKVMKGFMGMAWDGTGIAYSIDLWREVLRVLKPGAHLLAFGGTRTYHRMTCAIEDAGFEVRDSLHWMYGTGFPKSLNLGHGIGSTLKPGHEPIVMARKPLIGTLEKNVEQWGTGGLRIDETRIETSESLNGGAYAKAGTGRDDGWGMQRGGAGDFKQPSGRWPANVLLDEDAAAELDAQSGVSKSPGKVTRGGSRGMNFGMQRQEDMPCPSDSGGASRFFYVAKASRKERDLGCAHLPLKSGGDATDREDGSAGLQNPRAGAGRTGGARNHHPTVKPIELLRYLVRLVTPPSGTVIDPFTGSGTTGIAALREGLRFVGIEKESAYFDIAAARIKATEAREGQAA